MKKIQYSVDHNPSPENDKVIRDGIVDFNHSIINEKATHFSVFAKDKEKIIGGALIWEHTDALYIDVLWADEQYRGKGVGTEINAYSQFITISLKLCVDLSGFLSCMRISASYPVDWPNPFATAEPTKPLPMIPIEVLFVMK